MENQEYEMENQNYENLIENQTDVTIGEDCCKSQEETSSEQIVAEEINILQNNEETKIVEFCNEETANETGLQEENQTGDLEKEQQKEQQFNQKCEQILENVEKPIEVYAKYDEYGKIIEVNSDIFIEDFTGWTKIDEGFGDRFAHAQSQYLEPQE